jgi:hypothetical protein
LERGLSAPDVVFISYEEPNAEENFARLLQFAPHAKRVHHIEGVYNAWTTAAKLAETSHFFLVEADNWILDGFEFRAPEDPLTGDIYMWRARNAVNDLALLNGCMKFLSRDSVLSMQPGAVDFFLSMKGQHRLIEKVATETRFNTSPFLAWRCGFRECAKFINGMVDNPNIPNIVKIWHTVGADRLNGQWCMLGARMGTEFGRKHKGRSEMRAINDMNWLKARFAEVSRQVEERRASRG